MPMKCSFYYEMSNCVQFFFSFQCEEEERKYFERNLALSMLSTDNYVDMRRIRDIKFYYCSYIIRKTIDKMKIFSLKFIDCHLVVCMQNRDGKY